MHHSETNVMLLIFVFIYTLFFSTACQQDSNKQQTVIPQTSKQASVEINKKDTIKAVKWQPLVVDTTKKYIYLTFDDGPQNGTATCIQLLKKEQIKATFFMVGSHVKSDHLKKIVDTVGKEYPNLLLANHSTSHANGHYRFFYHHPNMAFVDFLQAQKSLQVPYKIIRLPGNSAWVRQNEVKSSSLVNPVCKKLDSAGYNVIGWDLEWSFNHKKQSHPVESATRMEELVEKVLNQHKTHTLNHLVILSHDRMFQEPRFTDSLSRFISLLKKHSEYVFETIDRYPALKTESMTIGQ